VTQSDLLLTLVLAFVAALGGGLLAARFRLPLTVGYLLAGVAIGPFTPGVTANHHLAAELSEVGVVLLMFGVGIHLSIRDLLAVRRIALPGALGQTAAATVLGAGLAWWWGWSPGAALVLGLAVSVASTVVLLRALDARGLLTTPQGRVAVGWLIVEDLVTVVILVLLPAVAGPLGGTQAGEPLVPALALALGKAALLVVLMLVVGARLLPWLFTQVAQTRSQELFTLAMLATALGVAVSAARFFGVSLALGAFLAGVVVGASEHRPQVAADALPFRDAFAVLFFVSVGMLVDPLVLVHLPGHVLALLAVVMLANPLVALLFVVACRYPLRTGLTVAAGVAQIGEFSFILVGLGQTLGLFSATGTSLILAVAVLSITLNPLLFRAADAVGDWHEQRRAVAGPAGVQPASATTRRQLSRLGAAKPDIARVRPWLVLALGVAVLTVVAVVLEELAQLRGIISWLYMLAMVPVALVWGRRLSLLTAAVATLLVLLIVLKPRFSFTASGWDYVWLSFTCIGMLVMALHCTRRRARLTT
jgi:K+:H+ antiporter